jgi:CubicO group peptidase (beta-lactamase class C family)
MNRSLYLNSKVLAYRLLGIIFGVCVLISPAFAQLTPPPDFDSYIAKVQKQFDVPGIAVSIVKDGQVILANGYGEKKSRDREAIDKKTLFCIGSNTKAFTAVALALLVEEGKLEWDTPIIRYVPWLQLADAKATKEFTIRDLLAHRIGLGYGAGDLLLWPSTTYTRKQIVRRIRFIPLATDFRSTYAYNNLLYVAAGELIEAVSGLSWEEFITTRIFNKVGMLNSSIAGTRSASKILNDNPAGGIESSAEDMAKWMICLLDSGRISGKQSIYSVSTARELWTPVTQIPIKDAASELWPLQPTSKSYALGFRVQDYRGRKLIDHTGELKGFVSRVAMVPELKLGVTVLVNSRSSEAYHSIIYKVLDYYLNAPDFDWIGVYQKVKARIDSAIIIEEQNVGTSHPGHSHPSLPLAKYAHVYEDKWYGNVVVRLKKGKLEIRFVHSPSLVGTLEHYQKNTFIIHWKYLNRRASTFITFVLNRNRRIDYATMKSVLPSQNRSSDFQDLLLRPTK